MYDTREEIEKRHSALKDRLIKYLKFKDVDIERNDLLVLSTKAGYTKSDFYDALREIENTVANIGIWKDQNTKKTMCRWYEPDDLTRQVQECLERGDNW